MKNKLRRFYILNLTFIFFIFSLFFITINIIKSKEIFPKPNTSDSLVLEDTLKNNNNNADKINDILNLKLSEKKNIANINALHIVDRISDNDEIFIKSFNNNINFNKNNEKEKENENNDSLKDIENEDLKTILNYKGGDIEPEWDWIRNISIVYTWVDGSELDFAYTKSKYNGGIKNVSSRDRSADELRYSIRSVQKYLPWHKGTIHILTNSQIPKWLDTTNPRVKVVFHKDIFPEHVSPTYDSNAIEMFLDKIPGITERFIYFNDDIFLNNYIHPAFFFTPKNFYLKIYHGASSNVSKERAQKIIGENKVGDIYDASKYYTSEIIKEYFDEDFTFHNLYHTPYVYYRDLLEPFRDLFKEEMKILFSNRFRNGHKFISQYLYHVYMNYTLQHPNYPIQLGGKGKAKDFKGKPFPKDLHRTIKKYGIEIQPVDISNTIIRYCKVTDNSYENARTFNIVTSRKNLLVYNFNDHYSKEAAFFEFSEFMINHNPEPSEFEKKEYVELETKYLKDTEKSKYVFEKKKEMSFRINDGYQSRYQLRKIIKEFKKNRYFLIEDYINKKNALSGPKKEISDQENEEIHFLTSYEGKELSSEWNWVKNITILYIVDNNPNTVNKNHWILQKSLKYSIYSIQKYLPWFEGKIILISQDENDEGLSWVKSMTNKNKSEKWSNNNDNPDDDANNDNDSNGDQGLDFNIPIEIINYKDFIPNEYYPTMNRHVIEMFLDKIPNLTEKFIYLKSTHFFNHYIHPRFFFSKEFYPKYFFKDSIPYKNHLTESENSFSFTHDILIEYFDKSYITRVRHHLYAPFVLYRDLFDPIRQLFRSYINETCQHSISVPSPTENYIKGFLPIYMIQNYNIYGIAQPFYPNYVAGYGLIREASLPKLNPERTVTYYGFDIPSDEINDATILSKNFIDMNLSNNEIFEEIMATLNNPDNDSISFFSFPIENLEE